jgi:hypothetical protein
LRHPARRRAEEDFAKVLLGKAPHEEKIEQRRKAARTLHHVITLYLEAKQPQLRANSYRVLELYLAPSMLRACAASRHRPPAGLLPPEH